MTSSITLIVTKIFELTIEVDHRKPLKIGQRVIICKFLKRSSPNTPDKKSEKKTSTDNDFQNDINSYDITIENETIILPFI